MNFLLINGRGTHDNNSFLFIINTEQSALLVCSGKKTNKQTYIHNICGRSLFWSGACGFTNIITVCYQKVSKQILGKNSTGFGNRIHHFCNWICTISKWIHHFGNWIHPLGYWIRRFGTIIRHDWIAFKKPATRLWINLFSPWKLVSIANFISMYSTFACTSLWLGGILPKSLKYYK